MSEKLVTIQGVPAYPMTEEFFSSASFNRKGGFLVNERGGAEDAEGAAKDHS